MKRMMHHHIRYNSPVVLTFTLISLVVLGLSKLTGGSSDWLLFSVYRSSFKDPFTYLRFFGHVLGHANFDHWIGNMMVFLLLGPMLEEKYGSKAMIQMILIVAFVTGVLNFALFPDTALMGASGVVFMMIILSSIVSVHGKEIPLTLILVAILYLGQEIYSGLFTADNISQLTHIVGGICGGSFGYLRRKGHILGGK